MLGNSEFALRLVPLLAGLAAVFLFFSLATRFLRPAAALLACFLFAIAEPLVYYSTELKQYSSDVAIELVLWSLSIRLAEKPLRGGRSVALGLLGLVAVFFSHTAVFVLGGIGLAFLLGDKSAHGRQPLWGVALAAGIWAAGIVGAYALSPHDLARNTRLVSYFTEFLSGFPPGGILPGARWLVRRLLALFEFPGGLDRGGLPALCAVAGVLVIARRNRRLVVTWVVPGALVLVAATARVYPFEGRLVLFVVPALYLLVAEGAEEIRLRLKPGGTLLAVALVLLLVLHPVAGAVDGLAHPRYLEQVAPVLRTVSASRRPGDVVYVYYGAQYAVRYYLETRPIVLADVPVSELFASATGDQSSGWYAPALVSRPPSFLVGSGSREKAVEYDRQLDGVVGRVWVIFAHLNPWLGVDERRLFLEHLDRIGTRLGAWDEPGASAFLYDLRKGS